ncbi:MAG TPA: hypothetical protein PLV45_17670, partial [bacterium]|nr:hypothetical protein [bacterium]
MISGKIKLIGLISVCLAGVFSGNVFADTLVIDIPGTDYIIESLDSGFDRLEMAGYGCTFPMGAPRLPSRIAPVALPPGAVFTGVEVDPGEPLEVPGTWRIEPRPIPRILSQDID